MDELLKRIEGLGISPDKAKEVITTVRTFLEEKLPDPIADKLDSILSGAPETMNSLLEKLPADKLPAGLGEKLGGLFGKK